MRLITLLLMNSVFLFIVLIAIILIFNKKESPTQKQKSSKVKEDLKKIKDQINKEE